MVLPGSLAAMATGLGTAHAAAGVEAALGTMTKMHIRGCIAFDAEQARCVTHTHTRTTILLWLLHSQLYAVFAGKGS